MRSAIIGAALGLFVTASPAQAIDCDGRLSGQEETICGNYEIRRMDYQLNRMYRDALRSSRRPGLLRIRQRAWQDDRRNCGNNERCLFRAYSRRMGQLQRED